MSNLRLDVTTDENERQLERHGFTAFPAAFYRGDLVNNTVIWHWHDELELILIHQGTIAAGAGQTAVTLKAGEGCFIKAGALHNIWKTDNSPCEYQCRAVFILKTRDGIQYGIPESLFSHPHRGLCLRLVQ